jgi:acetyl esterase/lipase
LYGSATPGRASSENWSRYNDHDTVVRNVTYPTITPFLPDPAKATGAAVIVAPGGAFMLLAIEPEGWRVAQALADRGIAAFVLKYRLKTTPVSETEAGPFMAETVRKGLPNPRRQPTLQHPPSTLVRSRAAEWGIDPQRVGMMGFSAGAMTTLNTTLAAPPGKGPNFIGYIYGPQPAVRVPAQAPAMFSTIAYDDELFPTMGFPLAEAWHRAGRPVEVHAYGRGGHGYGLGRDGTTTPLMLDQFTAWLRMEGFLTKTPTP